jgi:RNA polymerase sigma-70 factor (ECF subfamily)
MEARDAGRSEDVLLERARSGDPSALERLVERFQGRAYRFAMKICSDPEDAREVLQETLLALARGIRDFRGDSSLSTWLYTVARSFCLKRRRRAVPPPIPESNDGDPRAALEALADSSPGPEETVARRELARVLDGAIRSLALPQREVLVLRDVEGLPAEEVARIVGIGVRAVKSRLHRARAALRSRLAPILGPAEEKLSPPTDRCPDILALFSRHLEGEIRPELCEQMTRHLADCLRCGELCESLRRSLALCRDSPEPEVPQDIQAAIRDSVRRLAREAAARTGAVRRRRGGRPVALRAVKAARRP